MRRWWVEANWAVEREWVRGRRSCWEWETETCRRKQRREKQGKKKAGEFVGFAIVTVREREREREEGEEGREGRFGLVGFMGGREVGRKKSRLVSVNGDFVVSFDCGLIEKLEMKW